MRIRQSPKAETTYLLLKTKILQQEFKDNILPTEPELAEQLQVSRKTLRNALSRLELENYIVRIKSKGTFINCPEDMTGKVLVIVRDNEDITNPDRYILSGIQQEAAELNLQIDTCTCLSLTSCPIDLTIEGIKKKKYHGIISMTSNFTGDEPIIDVLKQTNLPILLPHAIPSDAEKTGFTVMGNDYFQIIKDALQYLIHLGHKNIAYLAYNQMRISEEKYVDLVKALGLDAKNNFYLNVSSHNNKNDIIKDLEKHSNIINHKTTAILCFSDFIAISLYEYLQKQNKIIPDDIAVISIGGMIGCDFLTPSLSSIDFDCAQIGRTAIRSLMELKKNKQSMKPFTVTPHHLTERESTRKTIKGKKHE